MACPEQQAIMRRLWADPEWRAQQLKQIKYGRDSMAKGEGYIYAVEVVGADVIKLGFALYPEFRVQAIKYSSGEDVRLLGYTPATIHDELALHRELREHRHPSRLNCREYYPRSILDHEAVPAALRKAIAVQRAHEMAAYQTDPAWAEQLVADAMRSGA
jgi:hypothetical protein